MIDITREELAAAIARDEISLAYQPQFTSDGARIVSVESLVRWQHPRHGLLSPVHFLTLAEKYGLMLPLTEGLIDRACREALPWSGISVAVNIPPADISPDLVDTVKAVLARRAFPPERLEVEITETSVFSDWEAAERTLGALRALGIRIALDDFGTGYSSLSLLRRLPIDKVKIDKSFVDDIGSLKSASIVHAVIALARAIGLKITAEGIESVEQQKFLRTAGCHYLQGYLFSRPVPPAAVPALLAKVNTITQVA